jgi:hypothetical protein
MQTWRTGFTYRAFVAPRSARAELWPTGLVKDYGDAPLVDTAGISRE